ncbi:MAG: sulfatase-like hydrolase/transferase [Planctomycetaceae bacterium]|nr:sulfatase-like hydrolase/transferase [Planctomycetaceae bacterium]
MHIHNRRHLAALVVVCLIGCLAAARAAAAERPNVLVILADDQGWGDLSIDGNTNLETPNIDSLGQDGALFERFFVCPVCAPTRAEFLTGRYHPRGGVHGVTTGAERLNLDEKTIAEAFKAAGYATGAFGKWHNGTQFPYHPNARGFDEYYGFTSGHWGHYFDTVMDHNGEIVTGRGFIIDDLTDHALDFIQENRERPFFCYVPYNTPHSPFQVPDRFYDRFPESRVKLRNRNPEQEELDKTRCALAMVENIDWNVGRLLEKLDALKLADNTIVVYFSDNGPNTWRFNGGMKGKKGSTDEGGVRSPCLVRWPGHIRPGTVIPQIAGAIDLLPTLTDMAGVERVGSKPLDGRSLKPLLTGGSDAWPERMIFSHWNKRVSVRTQQYRLDMKGALYDMVADPGQDRDISSEKPEITARLRDAVAAWKAEVLPSIAKDDRRFLIGFDEHLTILPARDGVPGGKVQRSGKAPNCSYFTNWTSTEDRITWDVEVLQAGEYTVSVYYTCPAADVGSTYEVSVGDTSTRGRVSEAYDPPLRGAEADRADRGGESYVKEFRPLAAGTMRLPRGRAMLTVRALEIPGSQVMDVRCVVLKKLP